MDGADDTPAGVETEGYLAPETVAAARDRYAEAVPTAKTATREAAKAMEFDRAEYERRVTNDVVAAVRDAVFASSLQVRVADRERFEAWRAETDTEVVLVGSESAPRVVWHAPGFADRAVAATFGEEREAAVGTLRRQAFGRLYREVLDAEDVTDADGGKSDDGEETDSEGSRGDANDDTEPNGSGDASDADDAGDGMS